jgi:hypothetical protein
MRSWFTLGALRSLVALAQDGVVITTDHGAVLSRRSSLVTAIANLDEPAPVRREPGCDTTPSTEGTTRFRLRPTLNKHYIVAKDFFSSITKFHGTRRTGLSARGISLEEMILPDCPPPGRPCQSSSDPS